MGIHLSSSSAVLSSSRPSPAATFPRPVSPAMKPFTEPFGGLSGMPMYLMAVLGCSAGFYTFGYDQGIASALLASPDFQAEFASLFGDATILGVVFALFTLGAMFGSLFVSAIGNRFGRRQMVIFGSVTTFVFAALQAGSVGLPMFIIMRFLNGAAVGILTSTVPPYIGELTKPKHRGLLMSLELVIGSTGLMTAFWCLLGFGNYTGPVGWRVPLALQAAFVVITITMLCWAPESPRWLCEVGRVEEGERVLAQLWGAEFASASIHEIREAIAVESETHVSGYKACFSGNKQCFRYRTMLSVGVNFLQQATGINMATYYGGLILGQAVSADLIGILLGTTGVAGSIGAAFGCFFLIDRLGRVRTLMLGSSLLCVAQCFLAGGIINIDPAAEGISAPGGIAVFGLYLFIFAFSMTWLPLGWIYGAEITPLAIRPQASSLGYAVQYIMNFMVVLVTPIGTDNIGGYYYIPWAISNGVTVIVLYFFFPEISGLSLEEIDLLFSDGKVRMRRSPSKPISSFVDAKPNVEHHEDIKNTSSHGTGNAV